MQQCELRNSGPFLHLVFSEDSLAADMYIQRRILQLSNLRVIDNCGGGDCLLQIVECNEKRVDCLFVAGKTENNADRILMALSYGAYVILSGQKDNLKQIKRLVHEDNVFIECRWSTIKSKSVH